MSHSLSAAMSDPVTYISKWELAPPCHKIYSLEQRVLNDWQRTRLSPVAWFLAHTSPLSTHLLPASCFFFSVFLCVDGRAYTGRRGVGEEPNENAWSSVKHSILSAVYELRVSERRIDYVVFVLSISGGGRICKDNMTLWRPECTEPVFVVLLRSPGIDAKPGGIKSSASIPGLHKRLQIRALRIPPPLQPTLPSFTSNTRQLITHNTILMSWYV